jgi:hypothetical protein
LTPLALGATSARLTGSIAGEVRNTAGVGQMGATVILLNRYDRVLRQALTNEKGTFVFDSLLPDLYSVRVTLASFVPAFKKNISVEPGLQSLLTINLAGVLSSIELVYTAPPQGALMSDDWKWVLRSTQSTRPVLRFTDVAYQEPQEQASHSGVFSSIFSDTRGVVRFSAGDGAYNSALGVQSDLGTAFALATSLWGSNQLEVSGNVGYSAHAGLPTAGFRTTYSRNTESMAVPEVIVTMRQVYLPSRPGFGAAPGQDSGPALRTSDATLINEAQVLDNLHLDYGVALETVSLVQRLNTLSSFARFSLDLGSAGLVQVAYSSGVPPVELAQHTADRGEVHDQELSQDITALATLPLISLLDAHPRVQRSDSVEVGYKKVVGSRTYSFGAYREHLKDALLTLAGDSAVPAFSDVLPDLGSHSSVFDGGNFDRWGYLASVRQTVADTLDVALAYGRTGALTTLQQNLPSGDAAELRSSLKMTDKNWATLSLSGTAPVTGTRFNASYGWMDPSTLMPARISLTQSIGPEPGLNVSIRQPIPLGALGGRLEAVGEVWNALAQGYLPVNSGGRSLLLTNSPRAVRGGLSFIF